MEGNLATCKNRADRAEHFYEQPQRFNKRAALPLPPCIRVVNRIMEEWLQV